MRTIIIVLSILFSTGMFAQKTPISLNDSGIVFSGDTRTMSTDKQVLELRGNASFSTSIVEIEKADKIVYDKKTKTFTISGFRELRIHGQVQLAEDLGPTTLKIDLGDNRVAYLIADENACSNGKGKGC